MIKRKPPILFSNGDTMNAKKCKALRRAVRDEITLRGITPPANGLLYKDTRKRIGWTFPKGWIKAAFARLATVGGPWFQEALKLATPQYARQALNVPGSERWFYREAKKAHA